MENKEKGVKKKKKLNRKKKQNKKKLVRTLFSSAIGNQDKKRFL